VRQLFFVCGELSGDLHGASLLQALRKQGFEGEAFGIAGPRLRAAGLNAQWHCEAMSDNMGWVSVAKKLPIILRTLRQVEQAILRAQPDAVILIDNPGFNLRLARTLRKHGYTGRLIQYICPKVWVHGSQRIDIMAQSLDLLLVIHPFEPPLFKDTSLTTHYVGHPLVAQLRNQPLSTERSTIALFPGSRSTVIAANLPIQLQAAAAYRDRIVISVAHPDLLPLVQRLSGGLPTSLNTHQLMASAQAALATCGTVTLELALMQVPTVVTYKIHPVDRWICRHILHLDPHRHYSLPNIIAQRPLFPEHIESRLDPQTIAASLNQLLEQRTHALADCQQVIDALGSADASDNAAGHIMALLETN
jgi:lipid-A-disaccharide synthase